MKGPPPLQHRTEDLQVFTPVLPPFLLKCPWLGDVPMEVSGTSSLLNLPSCVMDYHRELSGLGRRCDPLPNTAAGVAVPADPGRSARGPSVRRSRQDACPTRLALLALRLEEGNLDTDT